MARSAQQRWFDLAAVLIGLNGVFNTITGLTALFRKEMFVEDMLIYENLQVWAWAWLIIGLVQVGTAAALLNGGGRVFAIVIAALSAVVAFGGLNAAPLWSITVITIDLLIIYHLAKATESTGPLVPDRLVEDTRTTPPPLR